MTKVSHIYLYCANTVVDITMLFWRKARFPKI